MSFNLEEWQNYWPEWIPNGITYQLFDFFKFQSMSPADYESYNESAQKGYGTSYKLGDVVTFWDRYSNINFTGRYVYAWNNMCRLVWDDGTYKVFSFHDKPLSTEELISIRTKKISKLALLQAEIIQLSEQINGVKK